MACSSTSLLSLMRIWSSSTSTKSMSDGRQVAENMVGKTSRRELRDEMRPIQSETLEHDPEKWKPVFRKDHAQTRRRDHAATHQGTDRGAGEQHHDGAGDIRALSRARADRGGARQAPGADAAA